MPPIPIARRTSHSSRATTRRRTARSLVPLSLAAILTLAACARALRHAPTSGAGPGAWQLLSPGNSFAAWRGYRGAEVPTGWTLQDGVISRHVSTGDLVSRAEWGDFELEWEWQLGTGADAGIFYRGTEQGERLYESGVEYQLEDDAHPVDGPSRLAASGAVYGLYAVRPGVVRPAGEWNRARIVARGPHVEHWLNGERVTVYEWGSAEWTARVAGSKFARWPLFARTMRGHLAIQGDHAGDLAIRGLRIRELR